MITLQGPDKTYSLTPTLKLVADVEAGYGSLYTLAEDLLEKTLPLSEMAAIVKMLYSHAGCALLSDDFLLRQPCTEILITFLLEVLGPVERTGPPPPASFMDEMARKFPDGEET